jgi:hypothetical protein
MICLSWEANMALDLWNQYPVIDDNTENDFLFPQGYARGYDPSQYVPGMLASPDEIVEIPESEWDARIDEQEAQQSSLEHIWLRADSGRTPVCLDQNGDGYCWAYSCGSAMMVSRAKANQKFVRLNPHSVAAIIKQGRDEGGWCGLSCEFVEKNGMAVEGSSPGAWPMHSRDTRLDTPEMRRTMLPFRHTESWMDLRKPAYDRAMTLKQVISVLLGQNAPVQVDFNWWGHSVCAIRVVRLERGRFGLLILNSWKGWGRDGLSVLSGDKMRPDGAVCPRTPIAA